MNVSYLQQILQGKLTGSANHGFVAVASVGTFQPIIDAPVRLQTPRIRRTLHLTVDDHEYYSEPEVIEFQQELDSIIVDIYPVVLDRIRSAQFSGWQRRVHTEEDVAHQACAEFYAQCMRNRALPIITDTLLGYVVQIAINIANREYAKHKHESEVFVDPESAELRTLFAACDVEEDELSDFDSWLIEKNREERLLNALSLLTPRRREAFELWLANSSSTHAELGLLMNISEDGFRKTFRRACEDLEAVLNPKSGER